MNAPQASLRRIPSLGLLAAAFTLSFLPATGQIEAPLDEFTASSPYVNASSGIACHEDAGTNPLSPLSDPLNGARKHPTPKANPYARTMILHAASGSLSR
jgi:hypothetical protein